MNFTRSKLFKDIITATILTTITVTFYGFGFAHPMRVDANAFDQSMQFRHR